MAFQLDNSTFNFRWLDGNIYWANFAYTGRKDGSHVEFKGRLSGKGRCKGSYCCVVAHEARKTRKGYWENYRAAARALAETVDLFNKGVAGDDAVRVIEPLVTELDTVSTWNKHNFWARGSRLADNQPVVVEPLVSGKQFRSRESSVSAKAMALSDALSHYSYLVTHEEQVMESFRGIISGDHYYVRSPTIHSVQQDWGPSDMGLVGIRRFLSTHVCNDLCSRVSSEMNSRRIRRSLSNPEAIAANSRPESHTQTNRTFGML